MADLLPQLQRTIFDLSIFLHTEFSSLENLVSSPHSTSHPNLAEVLQMDSLQALDTITRIVKELVEFRREIVLSSEYDSYNSDQKYQKALQKLEGEVRNHVKIEQQMKLHIESLDSKLADTLKSKNDLMTNYKEELEQLKTQKKHLEHQIRKLDLEVGGDRSDSFLCKEPLTDRREEKNKVMSELVQLRLLSKRDTDKVTDLNRKILKLEHQVLKYKSALSHKERECRQLQKDIERVKLSVKPIVSWMAEESSELHRQKTETSLLDSKYRRAEPITNYDNWPNKDRSVSREHEGRSVTPIPNTMHGSKAELPANLLSHSAERIKRSKHSKSPLRTAGDLSRSRRRG